MGVACQCDRCSCNWKPEKLRGEREMQALSLLVYSSGSSYPSLINNVAERIIWVFAVTHFIPSNLFSSPWNKHINYQQNRASCKLTKKSDCWVTLLEPSPRAKWLPLIRKMHKQKVKQNRLQFRRKLQRLGKTSLLGEAEYTSWQVALEMSHEWHVL